MRTLNGCRCNMDIAVVPAGASSVLAVFRSASHAGQNGDPNAIVVWGLDSSGDGGKTWEHRCTVTRNGGPAEGERDPATGKAAAVDFFDVGYPLDGFAAGTLIRPFFGALVSAQADLVEAEVSCEVRFNRPRVRA